MINGHWQAVSYLPKKLKDTKKLYMDALSDYAPAQPLDCPIWLHVWWGFPCGKSHKPGEYKTTKPDTDNLMKLFKDCMTATGYWVDDSRVVIETAVKAWTDDPCIIVSYSEVQPIETESDKLLY